MSQIDWKELYHKVLERLDKMMPDLLRDLAQVEMDLNDIIKRLPHPYRYYLNKALDYVRLAYTSIKTAWEAGEFDVGKREA